MRRSGRSSRKSPPGAALAPVHRMIALKGVGLEDRAGQVDLVVRGDLAGGAPSETPNVADSSQLTVDSKQNNQKTLQPSGVLGIWLAIKAALKQVWQGFIGAVLKAFFASGPKPQGESRTDTPMVSAQTPVGPTDQGRQKTSSHGRRLESDDQSVFWGTMAGIPWIKAIRAKIKAGKDLTLWEKLFLVAAFFGRILHWTWHTSWPLAKSSFRWVGSRIKKALNGTLRFLGEVVGKPAKKVIQGVVGIALVLGLAYGLYLFFFHPAGLRGLVGRATSGVIHWVGSWVNPWEGDSKSIPQPQPTTIPTPGPKPPVSDQALAVPISKSDMGTPVPRLRLLKLNT